MVEFDLRGGWFCFEHKASLKPMEAAVTINSQQDKRSRQNGGQTEKHRKERVAICHVHRHPQCCSRSYEKGRCTEAWHGLILTDSLCSYSVLLGVCWDHDAQRTFIHESFWALGARKPSPRCEKKEGMFRLLQRKGGSTPLSPVLSNLNIPVTNFL